MGFITETYAVIKPFSKPCSTDVDTYPPFIPGIFSLKLALTDSLVYMIIYKIQSSLTAKVTLSVVLSVVTTLSLYWTMTSVG